MQKNSKSNPIIAILFCLGICLPLIGMTNPEVDPSYKITENREMAEMPGFTLSTLEKFPTAFETYFNDNFGFRDFLIRLHNYYNYKVYNLSSTRKALVGKEGWLFYTGNSVIDDYQGQSSLSLNDLEKCKAVLEAKRAYLKSRGVEYLFVVAPNKQSIYPEYLPDGITKGENGTFLDQLVEYLKVNSDVPFLDLRAQIKSHKNDEYILYSKTDTHWNGLGAYYGYNAIASHVSTLFPSVKPRSFRKSEITKNLTRGRDLAAMMGVEDYVKEEFINLSSDVELVKLSYKHSKSRIPLLTKANNPDLPMAVMFRDSFTTNLVQYLSKDFSEIKYIWDYWDFSTDIEKIINENNPNIVIEEMAERFVNKIRKDNPQINSFSTYNKIIYSNDTGIEISPLKQVDIDIDKDGTIITSSGTDPSFLLPKIDFSLGERFLFTFEIICPEKTTFQVFYLTEGAPVYSEKNSYRLTVQKGVNKFSIPLTERTLKGQIRVDPGIIPGEYIFKSIEVKASS